MQWWGVMLHFWHGTFKMDEMIDLIATTVQTRQKFFGGGDTLQEFKDVNHFLVSLV
jgi:phosphoglycerate kinase